MTALLAAILLLLQLLSQAFVTEGATKRPAGYVKFSEYNAAYKIHDNKLSWTEARDQCVEEGAHLAVITSVEKMKRIVHPAILKLKKYMFIGIHRSVTTDEWARADNGLPVLTHEFSGMNDDEDHACIVISSNSDESITDYGCDSELAFVCEKSLPKEGAGKIPKGYVTFLEYNAAYKIYKNDLPWAEAQDRCLAEGAHLAVITSVEKMKRIVDPAILKSEEFMFIGIHLSAIDKDEWVRADNGQPETSFTYSPLDDDEDHACIAMSADRGEFTDYKCADKLAFVCEISLPKEGAGKRPVGYVTIPEYNAAYKIHRSVVSWTKARDRCVAEGAHLAVITSVEQMKRVVDPAILASEEFMYIGIRRSSTTDEWVRVDNGLPLTSIEFSALDDNEEFACAVIWKEDGGSITDSDCNSKRAFVCEKSLSKGCSSPDGHQN